MLSQTTVVPIAPHGGRLVNLLVRREQREHERDRAGYLTRLVLNPRQVSDLLLLGIGAFSPLEGFMASGDLRHVVREGRLANGLPWTIPVTLRVARETAQPLALDEEIALCDDSQNVLGTVQLHEKYEFDKQDEASNVFRTTDLKHPGVANLMSTGDMILAGPVTLIDLPPIEPIYENFFLTPAETRYLFAQKGLRTVVAFQTRNPIHRAHEYIQRCALEIVDGLLIHPLVGETKADDIPAPVRMRCYQALMDHYYPKERVVLSVFPAAMRYAGPREAIFHAIVRKNYGCSHIIIGRDHAGVGNYYGSYDAHYIFDDYDPDEIGITPMFFDFTFFCRKCGHIVSEKTCRHGEEHRVAFSGTAVRQRLAQGLGLPEEFTRPEIAAILLEHARGNGQAAH